jgi:hypothetical protein
MSRSSLPGLCCVMPLQPQAVLISGRVRFFKEDRELLRFFVLFPDRLVYMRSEPKQIVPAEHFRVSAGTALDAVCGLCGRPGFSDSM